MRSYRLAPGSLFDPRRRAFLSAWVALGFAPAIRAAGVRYWAAGPQDYRGFVSRLRPGDALRLAPGVYERGLALHGLEGRPDAPIVIEAQDPARPPVFLGRAGANTVSLLDCRHLRVANLHLVGAGARVDAVKAEGHARFADHITLEGLLIEGHGPWQDVVGISTKCPASGWVVRANRIVEAGTGMYFGNSDGSAPFVGATVEHNQILRPVGYGMQIKHQLARSGEPSAQVSRVRHNLIVKAGNSSRGREARPNLLLGHGPLVGPGAEDRRLVYGNVLFGNPDEALLQAEGHLDVYNNLASNPWGDGLRVIAHKHRPREVAVFHNTVAAAGVGIEISGGEPGYARAARGNLVFANEPERGEAVGGNEVFLAARALEELVAPWTPPPGLQLAPRRSLAGDAASPLPEAWRALPGAGDDFSGGERAFPFAGACAPRAQRCG